MGKENRDPRDAPSSRGGLRRTPTMAAPWPPAGGKVESSWVTLSEERLAAWDPPTPPNRGPQSVLISSDLSPTSAIPSLTTISQTGWVLQLEEETVRVRSSGLGGSIQGRPTAGVTVGSLSLEPGEQRQVCWGSTPTSQGPPSCDSPLAVLGHATQAACRAQVCPALPVPRHLHLLDIGA